MHINAELFFSKSGKYLRLKVSISTVLQWRSGVIVIVSICINPQRNGAYDTIKPEMGFCVFWGLG